MHLVRPTSEQLVHALTDWQWLPGVAALTPLAVTALGDVFLHGSGAVWFLDTIDGTLTQEWDTVQDLQAQLNTAEGQDRFLLAGLVVSAHERGLRPNEGQVLMLSVPPILGGQIDVENLEVYDLSVALSLLGQIHRQIKDLPPGTQISGISVEGD